ncbi:hypothetical protein ACJMK2_022099 [Sinanodonta woodiana]|uniref:Uncharacterized protein n=1 Tax=Sinanodonta woodiana TaxID=1069815 RepID=A0ABD3TK17_SINWO
MSYPNAPPPSYGQATAYPSKEMEYNPSVNYPPPYAQQQASYDQPPVAQVEPGGYGNRVSDTPSTTFNVTSFSDKAIRRGFIRKVYLILTAQLLFTLGIIALFTFVHRIKQWITKEGGAWFYYVSYGVFLVTYILLICIPSVRRRTPGNFIALGIFTMAFSYMVGTISSFYETNVVLVAAGVTAAVCLSLTLFALQTKIDFTMCSGLLFALCMVLIFFGFSCMIVYLTVGYSKILDCVYGGIAALLFSLFLIYDTQMIVGGRKHELDPEEYVYGALQLYLDVVYLFLIILSLFGKSN